IFHVHIHVIPRQDGDQFAFPWPSVPGDVTEIEAQAERLRGAFTNDDF
ncbi:MAG: HIT family protein, partial [Thermoleophilia bacterium]|nr:HIT family protein [Thermoleophilia bacterium]